MYALTTPQFSWGDLAIAAGKGAAAGAAGTTAGLLAGGLLAVSAVGATTASAASGVASSVAGDVTLQMMGDRPFNWLELGASAVAGGILGPVVNKVFPGEAFRWIRSDPSRIMKGGPVGWPFTFIDVEMNPAAATQEFMFDAAQPLFAAHIRRAVKPVALR